jgi:hypothetical protein
MSRTTKREWSRTDGYHIGITLERRARRAAERAMLVSLTRDPERAEDGDDRLAGIFAR